MNIKARVAELRQAKDAARLAKAGRNHLAFVQTLKEGWAGIDDALAKVAEHKAKCAGCSAQIIDEIRSKMHA